MSKNQIIIKLKTVALAIMFANAFIEKRLKKKATINLKNATVAKTK